MSSVHQLQTFYQNSNTIVKQQTSAGYFDIVKVENLLITHKKKPVVNRRSYFKISFVEGKSELQYADRNIVINGSTLVFTNPIIPYNWEITDKKQSGYVCIFTNDFVNKSINLQQNPLYLSSANSAISLPAGNARFFKELFIRMEQELQSDYQFKFDLTRHILLQVIHEALKLLPVANDKLFARTAYERLFTAFTQLLEAEFSEQNPEPFINKSPAFFAEKLHVHINHLNKALRLTTGQSTTGLINQRLTQEAMFLLKNSLLSIKEIAWQLGFGQPQHFSGFFKRQVQQTPQEFRNTDK